VSVAGWRSASISKPRVGHGQGRCERALPETCCAWILNNEEIFIFHCQYHFILILIAERGERAEHMRNDVLKVGHRNNFALEK
jgi:hypothetical protein